MKTESEVYDLVRAAYQEGYESCYLTHMTTLREYSFFESDAYREAVDNKRYEFGQQQKEAMDETP